MGEENLKVDAKNNQAERRRPQVHLVDDIRKTAGNKYVDSPSSRQVGMEIIERDLYSGVG